MGTYTSLELAGYPILSTKSEVHELAMTLFRESDRQELLRRWSDRNPAVWGIEITEEEDQEEEAVLYRCSVQHAKERLDIMGFTLERARTEFVTLREEQLAVLRADADAEEDRWHRDELETLERMTLAAYERGLQEVVRLGLQPCAVDNERMRTLSKETQYLLDQSHYEHHMGFLCTDIRCLLRLALEFVPADGDVVQDVTDLINAGHYECDQKICEQAVTELAAGKPEDAQRIVLTEGPTDREFLLKSMELLYPHLVGYYTFFDFVATRSPGSASHLVTLVKAFAAAGITNRVIALFDNDAAALEALRALREVTLPDNIRVLTYPDNDALRSYPTIGPEGANQLDINGRAASVELYLGRDCLMTKGGVLADVQWTGFLKGVRRYQGELIEKADVQAAFRRKLVTCQGDPSAVEAHDWSGVRLILKAIFDAFRRSPTAPGPCLDAFGVGRLDA